MGISEQRNIAYILTAQFLDYLFHQGFPQSFSLVIWVDNNVPEGGIEGMIRRGSGKTNQPPLGSPLFPHGNHQEAVLKGFFDFPQGTARPAHSIAQFLQLVEINIAIGTEKDMNVMICAVLQHLNRGMIDASALTLGLSRLGHRGSIRAAKPAFPENHAGSLGW